MEIFICEACQVFPDVKESLFIDNEKIDSKREGINTYPCSRTTY